MIIKRFQRRYSDIGISFLSCSQRSKSLTKEIFAVQVLCTPCITSTSSIDWRCPNTEKYICRMATYILEMGRSIGIGKYRLKFLVSVSVFFNRYPTGIGSAIFENASKQRSPKLEEGRGQCTLWRHLEKTLKHLSKKLSQKG